MDLILEAKCAISSDTGIILIIYGKDFMKYIKNFYKKTRMILGILE